MLLMFLLTVDEQNPVAVDGTVIVPIFIYIVLLISTAVQFLPTIIVGMLNPVPPSGFIEFRVELSQRA